jgi:2-oxoisovalerate dehydrogenase E1 component
MEFDRAKIVDARFIEQVSKANFPVAKSKTSPSDAGLTQQAYLSLFECMLLTRHIDLEARRLKEKNIGFYSISSTGHETNAAIAACFRHTDMAFLHYRSSAFMLARARAVSSVDGVMDQLLSLVAAASDPISGGRHKIFGRLNLFVPPQTSTIASHLPKVFGTAFALTLSKNLKSAKAYLKLPVDSVILGSFGDASFNHSTLQGTLNAINWVRHKQMSLPLVLICEDNEIGISVPTPQDWIEMMMVHRPGWHYIAADGLNLSDVYQKSSWAEKLARRGEPVFLHVKMKRLLGHAGSDIEQHYRDISDIEAVEADDPLLHTARQILEQGWLSKEEIIQQYQRAAQTVARKSEQACLEPRLADASAVMASLIPPSNPKPLPALQLETSHSAQPRTMAQLINVALSDILESYPQSVIFGEDVGKKGGVYRITADLQAKFGVNRVFDSLLDEQTILGTAIGMAHHGLLPIPEIQFLAYTYNAVDQIRGEAATLSFFSSGQFTNPMVIRIASLGYQKGFGGHFHNDNAIAFLREIPSLVIACPSSPAEAALLLKACVEQAYLAQRVVVFLEPIALYFQKDVYEKDDGLFLEVYPDATEKIDFGQIGIEGQGKQLAIISYGNGHFLSRQAIAYLNRECHIETRLIDLRWLAPLNETAILEAVQDCEQVLIVDEGRKTASISDTLMAMLSEQGFSGRVARVTGEDTFIPIGKALEYVLPSVKNIIKKVMACIKMPSNMVGE